MRNVAREVTFLIVVGWLHEGVREVTYEVAFLIVNNRPNEIGINSIRRDNF